MFREPLSEREKQVTAHLVAGLRIAGVAQELDLAENTVRNHVKHVFSKLDIHSQSELIDFVRQHPSVVAPYHLEPGVQTGTDIDLVDEIAEIDRALQKRLDSCASTESGLERMKAMLRAVLPLDETRRHEWRVRLAAHAMAPHQRAVREASRAQHEKWKERPLKRITDFQTLGWIRPELDPEDVRRRIFAAVYAAVLGILSASNAEEEDQQLAAIDRLLQSVAAENEATK